MDFFNFNFSKESLPTLAIILIIVGFILYYIFSFIGKIIRFFALVLAGILFILYYSGYNPNPEFFQNLIQNTKLYVTKLINEFAKNLNSLKNKENSELNFPNLEKANNTYEKR